MKTAKQITLLLLGLMFIGVSCKKNNEEPDDPTDPTDPDSDISLQIQQELDDGKDFYDMITEYGYSALYGKKYEGGLIYHIDGELNEGYVVRETDEGTTAPWGCPGLYILDPWYGYIGGGWTNTVAVRMDCEDTGIAVDITGTGSSYSGWFLPSAGSMEAIKDRIDSKGLGNFSSELYWTSTGYDDDQDRALAFSFETGNETPKNRGDNYLVRAVRSFEY